MAYRRRVDHRAQCLGPASLPRLAMVICTNTSYGYDSRSSSPSKLRFGSSTSHPDLDNHSSLLSPPVRPSTGFRTLTGIRPETPTYTTTSYTAPSYTNTPSAFSNTITWSYTTPNGDAKTIHESEDTLTQSTFTPTSTLGKSQSPPRSPLSSARNIVARRKDHTPASVRTAGASSDSPRKFRSSDSTYPFSRRWPFWYSS